VPSNTIFVKIKLNYNWQIGRLVLFSQLIIVYVFQVTLPYFSSEELRSTSISTAVDDEVLQYYTVVLRLYDRLRLYSWVTHLQRTRSLERVAGSMFHYLKIFGEVDRLS